MSPFLLFLLPFVLLIIPSLAFSAALFPPPKNASLFSYTKGDELCAREAAKRLKYCNLHNPTNLCICYAPIELVRDDALLCANLIRLDSLEYLGFLSDPDSIVAEDLELFTGFSQASVLFLRKGCSSDHRSYIFQFAILRHSVNPPFNDTDLRLIYPRMFKSKRFFMRQEGLIIARVKQSKFLLPLIGFSSPEKRNPKSVGFCPLRNVNQCYGGEMALLFFVSLYASAEICSTTLISNLKYPEKRRRSNDGKGTNRGKTHLLLCFARLAERNERRGQVDKGVFEVFDLGVEMRRQISERQRFCVVHRLKIRHLNAHGTKATDENRRRAQAFHGGYPSA
ncbi:hypothetical protein niasHT_033474 [Heterodera trifolii]|uniref:Effector protein n=1 Tax=Heterodera trifolii TaxID=157864 RepID=A0ABD2J3U3_9BILA